MALQVRSGPTAPVVARPPVGILEKSGTFTTPQGPITWTQASDGTINAEGGGQKFTSSGQNESDGSWQKHADYARTGQAPYLTMEWVGKEAEHQVEFTLSAGSSHLTLTVSNIDARVTSGTATLSGTWIGAAVNWTGHVDLTSNPFVGRPIAGWPAGAFAPELRSAAFFAPLGNDFARKIVVQPPATTGSGGKEHIDSVGGVLGKAGAWCVGGAIAGAGLAPVTLGTASLLGCAGGATGSLLDSLISYIDTDPPTQDPVPNPGDGAPLSPPQTSDPQTTLTQQDSNEPGGQGGDGSGGGGDGQDDKPTHEEE
jgi:hypothetical protein